MGFEKDKFYIVKAEGSVTLFYDKDINQFVRDRLVPGLSTRDGAEKLARAMREFGNITTSVISGDEADNIIKSPKSIAQSTAFSVERPSLSGAILAGWTEVSRSISQLSSLLSQAGDAAKEREFKTLARTLLGVENSMRYLQNPVEVLVAEHKSKIG